MVFVKDTGDGRKIGIEAIEILAFPDIEMFMEKPEKEKLSALPFLHFMRELRTVNSDNNVVAEILWLTYPAEKQAYTSEVRIYLILREIGYNVEQIISNLEQIDNNVCLLLKVQNYELRVCEDLDILKKCMMSIENDCVYALNKKGKYTISMSSQCALFYNDILDCNMYDSFENLISVFSELKDSAISFQISPVNLNFQEKLAIGEMVSLYHNIAEGNFTKEKRLKDNLLELPLRCVDSYYSVLQDGLLEYNILIFGTRQNANRLANRIVGMLKENENKLASFEIMDISKLKIKLYSEIYTYPWNTRTYINLMLNKLPFNNNSEILIRKLGRMMSEGEALNFFRLPIHSGNTLALNSMDAFYVSEQINTALLRKDNIKFGMVNTVNNMIEIGCPKEQFSKHALIVGMPGTGKTTFSLNLLLQFYRQNVPFLAIEPTKTEYRALIEKIPEIQVFTPGNNEISPFIINPFMPPRGIKIEQYIPALVSAFGAAFSMESPLDVIFLKAIRTAYIEYGWKDYNEYGDPGTCEFGLYEFVMIFKKIIKDSAYSREVKGNLESGGTFRLLNLIEQNGNIYDTIKNIPIEDILTKPTVIELNAIQDGAQKALIMALLLSNICLYTKLIQHGDGKLKNVILIDEAHVLLGNDYENENKSTPKGTTVTPLKAMVAEIRSYGTGIIIADQSAKKVSRDIVANTDIKVIFRLVEKEEKEILCESINADTRIKEHISRLKMGEAFLFLSMLEKPQLIKTPDVRKEENIKLVIPNRIISQQMKYWEKNKELLKPFRECEICKECKGGCDYHIRSDAGYLAKRIYAHCANKIIDKNEFIRHVKGVEVLAKTNLQRYDINNREKMIKCCMFQLRRKIELETNLKLSDHELFILINMRGTENNG